MRHGWIAAAALLACLSIGFGQDPQPQPEKEQDPGKRLEEALKEIETIRDELLEAAKEIRQMRQANESLRAEVESLQSQLKQAVSDGKTQSHDNVSHGPKDPMMGTVIAIGRDYGWVLAVIEQKSDRDQIKIDYTFNIQRADKLVARGTVTKIIQDSEKSTPKVQIKITRGKVDEVKMGDSVVAQRQVVLSENPEGSRPAGAPARITGIFGKEMYAFDRGRNHNLRQGERAYVYREGEIIAVLKLEVVEPDSSIGRVEPGTKRKDPVQGDVVEFERVGLEKVEIFGRVVYSDREIILDVGTKHGCRPGQKFEVRRSGQKVGELVIKDAQFDRATAEPFGATKKTDLQKGDLIELIKD
ncbi:MAG TPA: hypothetical protein VI643_07185 [Planctomycetota bacterium]|nr:hypothetical protein [Planctomycetota bacterium]